MYVQRKDNLMSAVSGMDAMTLFELFVCVCVCFKFATMCIYPFYPKYIFALLKIDIIKQSNIECCESSAE